MDLTWDDDAERRTVAISRASAVGATVSRNSLLWHRIEPTRGQRDWNLVDAVVTELEANGIEPLFTVYGSPSWANGVGGEVPMHYAYVPTSDSAYQEWLDQFVDFIAEGAQRYRGRVRWEIWNEQNEPSFWKPTPDAGRYREMYERSRAAIRATDPGAQVAVGGLAGLAFTGPGGISGRDYLNQLLGAGLRPDAVAIHPYASKHQGPSTDLPWENNFSDVGLIANLIASKDLVVPLWVTEWGWWASAVGEQAQADHLAASLALLRDDHPSVTLATYFIDYDRPGYSSGLFDEALAPKPAAAAFAAFAPSFSG
ncbi:MAG: cellulase family glycosylhydrolase [Miltoncostaeaceae bacterium]